MLPDSFLQELKYRSDIEQVVGGYVNLRRRGRTLSGLCPFHSEKSPSFTVYPENQSFYCFGCGAGGDVITFIRKIENLDYIEAVRLLAQKAGIAVPENQEDDRTQRLRKRVLEANREAARYFHRNLMSERGRECRAYLINRGLTRETIVHFGIGFASESWDELLHEMQGKGFTREELIEAHLVTPNQKGGAYDSFRNRTIFPIIDLRGNVIAFGGRNLGEKGPKYLNSSDTPVFKKSRNLFALNFAKNSGRTNIILCEGYMDVVSMHQGGFTNAVATLGTAMTEEQARLLAQYTKEVILSYDSDGPGQAATQRATGLLEAVGIKIKVLAIPDAKDPDEYIKKFGAERFEMLLEGSSSATEYQIKKLHTQNDIATSEGKVAFLKQFAELLAGIPSPIEREVYLSKICRELEVDKAAVQAQVEKEFRRRTGAQRKKEERELTSFSPQLKAANREEELLLRQHPQQARAEERILQYLLRHPDCWQSLREKLPEEKLLTDTGRELYRTLTGRYEAGRPIELSSLSSELSETAVGRLTGWMVAEGATVSQEEAGDCIRCLLNYGSEKSREEIRTLPEEELRQYIEAIREKKQKQGQ